MRPFEFRIWDYSRNRMRHGCDNLHLSLSGDLWNECGFGGLAFVENENWENYEIMQFTGIFDKNGKKVFEGDVIGKFEDDRDILALVEYCAPEFRLKLMGLRGKDNYVCMYNMKREGCDKMVIGNKFENPWLITPDYNYKIIES